MHHVVQANLFNEFGFRDLLVALEENNAPYTVVKVIPFAHELEPDIIPEGAVMVWGATTNPRSHRGRERLEAGAVSEREV